MPRRILLSMAVGLSSVAPAAAAAPPPAEANGGFRLESKPVVDDVFGDAGDYRRVVDRFIELADKMQAMRDEFARSVQSALTSLGARSQDGKTKRPRVCPVDLVAQPYDKAQHLGAEYLRIGRELARHYDQVKEFDRLGESMGLTPDYRWKVRRVLQQYQALLTDYREMKVAFHDQLIDELKFAHCDLATLLLRGDPQAQRSGMVANDESWPPPGQPGAPGSPAKPEAKETLPPNLPSERVPPPQPISVGKPEGARSGVLFYVDNTRCGKSAVVYVDGKKLGEVPAATRVGFQAAPGPHDLCLMDGSKKDCGAPGTTRRSYLHEGWTIALRCE
jgi:hypothetical protein